MQKTIFSILKYVSFVLIAGGLFWYVYRDQDISLMMSKFANIRYEWIALSALISVASHVSRGWRWAIAMRPLGYQVSVFRTFLAVMAGYLVNLVVPRGGEVARCGLLKRTDNLPITTSIGAVITERTVDFVCLVSISTFTVLMEYDRIGDFLVNKVNISSEGLMLKVWIFGAVAAAGLIGLILVFVYRKALRSIPIINKIFDFGMGLKGGLLSIFKLKRNEFFAYIFHTILIWLLYYLMAYVLFFTMPETENLSLMCGLSVLIMGGLGIIVPTPGGVGSYHLFVSTTFVAYGTSEEIGTFFAFLMHSSQTLTIVLVGVISFLISLYISTQKKTKPV
jgi:uncharacterized protein (TIRG00374 family)